MATTRKATDTPVVGVLSLGEMGTGIAQLLLAHDYQVATCTAGRSKHTLRRIQKSGIKAYDTDAQLVAEVDVLLSIVPPRDAVATAVRILEASRNHDSIKRRRERKGDNADDNLIYIDCNAISAKTSRNIAAFFAPQEESDSSDAASAAASQTSQDPPRRFSLGRLLSFPRSTTTEGTSQQSEPQPHPVSITYLDGGIIGGPPSLKKTTETPPKPTESQPATEDHKPTSSASTSEPTTSQTAQWKRPSLVLSGPSISTLLPAHLLTTLNATSISPHIGSASTLKSCFAATTKGLTALLTISLATASQAHVLPQLLSHMEGYAPHLLNAAKGSMPNMPPKAYRWVEEMKQIGSTFATEGGLECGEQIFEGVAELYRFVSEDTVLGEERTEARKRGRTAEDVAGCVAEGVKAKRRKAGEGGSGGGHAPVGEENLKLVWRESWS